MGKKFAVKRSIITSTLDIKHSGARNYQLKVLKVYPYVGNQWNNKNQLFQLSELPDSKSNAFRNFS